MQIGYAGVGGEGGVKAEREEMMQRRSGCPCRQAVWSDTCVCAERLLASNGRGAFGVSVHASAHSVCC